MRWSGVAENTELFLFSTLQIFISADPGNSIRSFLTEQQSLSVSKERSQRSKSKESKKLFLMPKILPEKQTFHFLPTALDFHAYRCQQCYYQAGGPDEHLFGDPTGSGHFLFFMYKINCQP